MTQQNQWVDYKGYKFYKEYMKRLESDLIFHMTGWLGKPFTEEERQELREQYGNLQSGEDNQRVLGDSEGRVPKP